jgi:TrmH family RNA methyltransferase
MPSPVKSLKWYRQLATGKGRQESGAFLVEGSRAISQIIAGHPNEIQEILSVDEPPANWRKYPVRRITESQCDYISSTRTPQGLLAVVRLPKEVYNDRLPDETGEQVLLLEDIQDPGNAGTLIRTAAAFDFSGIIMSGKCADPLSPKCVQATAGAVLSLWIRRTVDYLELAESMKDRNYTIVAADIEGKDGPAILKNQEKLLLALGNEAAGLSKNLLGMAEYRLRIPTARDKAESLNVAACGAICMYLSSNS